jgi:flagellar protein FlaJ
MTDKRRLQLDEALEMFSIYIKNLPADTRRRVITISKNILRSFQKVYLDSGITTYIDDYINRAMIVIATSFIALFLVSLLTFTYFFQWPSTTLMLNVLVVSLVASVLTGLMLAIYPYYKRGEAKNRLEDGLIYFLSYMTVLSASGMSIERILEKVSEVEDNPPLVHLAKKFIMNVKLFGMDIKTALTNIAEMSPSKALTKQIESIRTAVATSGDLRNLLAYEVDRQLQVKRERLKAKLNSLVYIGELYTTLMVVTPIIFIIVIAILSVMGGASMGGSPILQLNIIVFLGIPLLGAAFVVILDQTMGREE